MKKNLPFDILSTQKCCIDNCLRYLKQRIVNQKPTAGTCYTHYKALRKRGMGSREARYGIFRRTGLQHR